MYIVFTLKWIRNCEKTLQSSWELTIKYSQTVTVDIFYSHVESRKKVLSTVSRTKLSTDTLTWIANFSCMKCAKGGGSISFPRLWSSSVILLLASRSRKHKGGWISYDEGAHESDFGSFHLGLSPVDAAVHWAILDESSALDPASDMRAPRYLHLVTVWSVWPLAFFMCECRWCC